MMNSSLYGTRLYVNCDLLKKNINYFKNNFPFCDIMAVVKANAYGHGDLEISLQLKRAGVTLFAVADFEEGIRLRTVLKESQIMIMNPGINNLSTIIKYNLEPVIYSNFMLDKLLSFSNISKTPINIHIKLNTGMNRWGFNKDEARLAVKKIAKNNNICIKSMYSHLASSEDPKHDKFTQVQIETLFKVKQETQDVLISNTHMFNSYGSLRFLNKKDKNQVIRLGISLYGGIQNADISPISELKCTVNQIRTIHAGEHVGYNLEYTATKSMKIGIISLGYADGLQRSWGNGVLKFYYNGQLTPTIGNISMDSCIIDLSNLNNIREGDDVIYFGLERPIWILAQELNTIPYEIISSLSQRIKRIYVSNNEKSS